MAKIISIGTAVPRHKHKQQEILQFMEHAYRADESQKRILRYLYKQSGIETRYSVVPDYTLPVDEWQFFPLSEDLEPFPGLDKRMDWFQQYALPLSLQAAHTCLKGIIDKNELTNIITVSCTGMSAPGLEMQMVDAMQLPASINRSAINFMGCYAAIHALKQANDIVAAQPEAKVLIVCTELCTLHFNKIFAEEFIAAPLLFADGSAAVLVTGDDNPHEGLHLKSFYSEVLKGGKDSMKWELSATSFVMTLASDVPELFRRHIAPFKDKALQKAGMEAAEVKYWCIHPGGRKILEVIAEGLLLPDDALCSSYRILREYGNMSSPSVLFVLNDMWGIVMKDKSAGIFSAAFGPGLTIESMIMTMA